ncbi:hypothetical protein B0H14DRAFT_2567706 [Mycena olivaceomarginata]|nr:hypothetical protein B0H14DRAFT_2567706 [Mycena olivaceomarginata]
MTLPDKLPQFIEAGLKHPTERHRYSPLISQAEFDLIRKDEDLVQIFAQDSMNFEGHMKHLCRLFNRFKGALNGSSSEVTIRRAVDDLLELAFETDPNALVNSSYLWVPLPSCYQPPSLPPTAPLAQLTSFAKVTTVRRRKMTTEMPVMRMWSME